MRGMRPLILPLLFSLSPLALAACGSTDANTDDRTGDPADDGKLVIETYGICDAEGSRGRRETTGQLGGKVAVLVPTDDGYAEIGGELESPTRASFHAAPEGPFFYAITSAPYAELPDEPARRHFYEADGRRLWLGGNHIARCDLEAASPDARLRLDLSGLEAWEDSDSFELVSKSAEFLGTLWTGAGDPGEPVAGATSIENWELELASVYSEFDFYRVESGDDLMLVQQREGALDATDDPTDPWYEATIFTSLAAVDLSGTTIGGELAEISGAMESLPRDEFHLDLRTSTFIELIEQRLPGSRTMVEVESVAEPVSASGEFYFGVDPTLWWLGRASTNTEPVDRACYPFDGVTCPGCDTGICDDRRHFIQPGDLDVTVSSANPFGRHMERMV